MQNKIVHPRLIRAVQALIPTRRINSLQKKFLPSFISNLSLKEKEIRSINAVLPNLDRETMSLQQCQYVLPITKAKKILGYQPSISFSEGCRRSNYWIKFAFGLLNN
jgi:nucleoside-diphosphate-sugar epimerase